MPRKKKYGRTPTNLYGSFANNQRKAFDFTMNRMYDMLEEHTYYQEKIKFQAKIISGGTTGGTAITEPSTGRVTTVDNNRISFSYKIRFIDEDQIYNLHDDPEIYSNPNQREALLALQPTAIHEVPASEIKPLPYDTIVSVEKINSTYFIVKVIEYPAGTAGNASPNPSLQQSFQPPVAANTMSQVPSQGETTNPPSSNNTPAASFGGKHAIERLEKQSKVTDKVIIGIGSSIAAQNAMKEMQWWTGKKEQDVMVGTTVNKTHKVYKRLQLFQYYGKQDRNKTKGKKYRKLNEYVSNYENDKNVLKTYIGGKPGNGTGDRVTGIMHWSATSISWVMRGTGFPSRDSHTSYSRAIKSGKAKDWELYSLKRNKIKPKLGDVCVRTGGHGKGSTTLTAAHGDVIYKIDGNFAYVAGGNLGSRGTFRHEDKLPLDEKGLIKDSKRYLIILKKMKSDSKIDTAKSELEKFATDPVGTIGNLLKGDS